MFKGQHYTARKRSISWKRSCAKRETALKLVFFYWEAFLCDQTGAAFTVSVYLSTGKRSSSVGATLTLLTHALDRRCRLRLCCRPIWPRQGYVRTGAARSDRNSVTQKWWHSDAPQMQSESSTLAWKRGRSAAVKGDAPWIFPVTMRAVAPLDAASEAYSCLRICFLVVVSLTLFHIHHVLRTMT